jgi:NAD-dependent dihydropyrimidine dehydrogenase PreA subunit
MLIESIKTYVAASPLNRLTKIDNAPMWDAPLVGFADGDDPLFTTYKTVVGDFHLTPRQAMATHERAGAEPARIGVVSWILPTTETTRRSNRDMSAGPSLRWNHTRFEGEAFNDSLRRHIVGLLEAQGVLAVAPVITPHFRSANLASTWSERHIAYAAGLGTFSLSDGLITARGIAHRCGSVVFAAACTPTLRPYTHYQQYCTKCGECMARCPVGAITEHGHDKVKCSAYLTGALAEWVKKPGSGYMGAYSACGLCQTYVACEVGRP